MHNQHIERLWRDVFNGCTHYFHTLFQQLENIGQLDPDNDIDIYSLHYVFLPWIQHQLDVFRDTWSCHALRTERSKSPIQIWLGAFISGQFESAAILGICDRCHEETISTLRVMGQHMSVIQVGSQVNVEETVLDLTPMEQQIITEFDPIQHTVDDCVELYLSLKTITGEILLSRQ